MYEWFLTNPRPPSLLGQAMSPVINCIHMALKKADFAKLAGQKSSNLSLDSFEFNESEGFFISEENHKLSKLTYVGLRALEDLGIEFTLIAPKAGSEWARAWF